MGRFPEAPLSQRHARFALTFYHAYVGGMSLLLSAPSHWKPKHYELIGRGDLAFSVTIVQLVVSSKESISLLRISQRSHCGPGHCFLEKARGLLSTNYQS